MSTKLSFAMFMFALVALPLAMADKNLGPAELIADLEHKWADGQKRGDAAAVAPMLASNFESTDVNGNTYGREKLLANLKGGKWEKNEIGDVKVRLYGNTAIATGTWTGKGVDGDGTKIDRHERWTDTWIRMPGGNWQCVASHASSIQ